MVRVSLKLVMYLGKGRICGPYRHRCSSFVFLRFQGFGIYSNDEWLNPKRRVLVNS